MPLMIPHLQPTQNWEPHILEPLLHFSAMNVKTNAECVETKWFTKLNSDSQLVKKGLIDHGCADIHQCSCKDA